MKKLSRDDRLLRDTLKEYHSGFTLQFSAVLRTGMVRGNESPSLWILANLNLSCLEQFGSVREKRALQVKIFKIVIELILLQPSDGENGQHDQVSWCHILCFSTSMYMYYSRKKHFIP